MTGQANGGDHTGGGVEGQEPYLHPPRSAPRDVSLEIAMGGRTVIHPLPPDLQELVDWRWPDALWIKSEKHSSKAYTIEVLDLDYRMTFWRASLSVDYRWTLSPVGGPWEGRAVFIEPEGDG